MRVVVIDGQGGGIGRSIVERLKAEIPSVELIAVGTNAVATANMMKGSAVLGATGENAVVFNCANADIVIGPIGIYFANAMMGEITPKMAEALASCRAKKIAIPATRCNLHIMGITETTLTKYIEEAINVVNALDKQQSGC